MRTIHIGTFQRLTIIGVLLAAALLLGSPAPSDAAEIVLVSNTGQHAYGGTPVGAYDHAQGFTTGKNTLGYVLTSIELQVHTAPANGTLTVSVREADGQDPSDTVLHTLTNPSNLGTGLRKFTAPANSSLSAETTYFVHMIFAPGVNPTQPQWDLTDRTTEDSGAYDGWSIANVRHSRPAGSSVSWSNTSDARIKIKVKGENRAPAAPANLSPTVGDGQVTLSWDDPGNDTITKYQYSTNGGTNFTDIGSSDNETTAYTVTGLTNGTQYTLAVRAVNDGGDGTASTVTATPETVPDAPTSLTATGADTSVTLAWTASVSDGGSAITMHQYRQKAGTDNYGNWTDIPESAHGGNNAIGHTVTGLDRGKTYTFLVRAVNSVGNSIASGEASALTAPAAPVNLTAMPLDMQVQLTWDDPGNTTITKYELLQLAEESGLIASDAAKNDRFGVSVAVDDDTAVVGAFQPDYVDSGTNVSRPGAAYVYTKDSNGAWSQQAKLTASDGADGDEFGISVAVDGDTVVVGARGNVSKTGAIYVFTKPSDGDWTSTITEIKLTATGGAADDLFGASVALYGESTIVVGALGDQNSVGGTDVSTGSAYVFTRNSETGEWSQNAKLTASNAGADDLFGNSVAVDDDTIAVGAYGKDGNSLTDSGLVYVFVKSGGAAWATTTETVQLRASDRAANDNFGRSVAVDTDTIVVGASGDQNMVGGTEVSNGSAYVFTEPNNGWTNSGGTETAKLTASDGAHSDQFGRSVAVAGDTIVVGAHQNDDDGVDSGSIYVFVMPTNGWEDSAGTVKLTASNAAAGDRFGIALALDGATALVAAPRNDANDDDEDTSNDVLDAGSAYVFEIKGWTDVPENDANNRFHAVTDLTNFYTYTFALRAVNASGDGPASTATDTPMPGPAAPANLSGTPRDGRVTLSWTDPGDDTIKKYQYSTDYMINGGGMGNSGGASFTDIQDSDGSTTEYTVTGLTNGATHTLAVRAVNAYGNGMVATLDVVMVPAAPKLSAAPGDGQVVLSWDDPANPTIGKYQLSQSDLPEWSEITGSNATTTTHPVTGLTNYTGYSFQIRAVNETGAGPASNSASATPRLGKPAKPAGMSAQAGDAQVMLNWDDPMNSTIDKYQISEVIPEHFLTASGSAAGAHFGISVAIDGDTAVVGSDRANSRKGSAYIFTRNSNGNWIQQAKLDGEETGDQFGWSVAVDGDTVVVGAHAYDGEDAFGTTINSGAAYVITKPNTDPNGDGSTDWKDWNSLDDNGRTGLTAKMTPSDPEFGALFGGSVDLDGDTLVIGSRLADVGGYLSAGAAYVFTKPDTGWADSTERAKLTASDRSSLAHLGYSVAVDGDTVLAGAFGSYTAFGRTGNGSAYIFVKPASGWADGNETTKLTASDLQPSDYFGFSVALDGDTAVVGARQHNDPVPGAGSGAAYVFTRESEVWGEKAKLTASDAAAGDNFGVSVAVEDDTVVVGSWQDDDNGRNSGSAYVFTKPALGWAGTLETLKLTAPNGAANDRFGWSVAVDLDEQRGDLALVGAYSDDIATGMDAGSVHVLGIPNWVNIGDENDDGIDYNDDETISHNVTKVPDGTDTDLSNGTEYTFQIRAQNRSGAGPASDGAGATPLGPPSDLRGLMSEDGDTQVRLYWNAPAEDSARAPITRYEYQYQEKDTNGNVGAWDDNWEKIPDSGPATTEYMKTELVNKAYTFRVRAVNMIGESPASTVDATPTGVPPAAPTNLAAAVGDTQVRLTWNDPNDSSIDKYILSTDNTTYTDIDLQDLDYGVADKFRYAVTDLINGTEYTFYIRAVDNAEQSPASTVDATPMASEPATPENLKAKGLDSKVELTWDDPYDSSIDRYEYQWTGDNGTSSRGEAGSSDDWIEVQEKGLGRATAHQDTVTGLTNGVLYTFVIRAVDTDHLADPFSAKSGEASATPLPGRPGAPTNLTVTGRNQQATLTWKAPPGSVVDKYEVLHLQISELAPLNVVDNDKFGYSVAVDGDIAVVGAYRDGEKGDGYGAAYVFTRSGGVVWDEGVKLTASDGDSYDNFGISVAVDGNTIVVGASGYDGEDADGNTRTNSGAAYVFTKDQGTGVWSQVAKLTASDGAALDYFGHSVAVSSDTVLVGAYLDDREETVTETALEDSGSVYVFTKPTSEGGWSDWNDLPQTAANENNDDKDALTAKLTASDAADDDNFGTSVALDGDTAVIGAPGDDDKGIDSGSAYFFTKPSTDNGWSDWAGLSNTAKVNLTAKRTADDGKPGDSFGVSVTVDGDTAVVGAYQHDPIALDSDPNSPSHLLDAGAAYVFTKTASAWNQSVKLTADDRAPGDYFGYSVAVDDGTVLVGAYQDDDKGIDSGSAYVFIKESETGEWSQSNKLTEDPGEADGWFGHSVAVDTGAHTALVGAGSAHAMDIHDWEEVSASGQEITYTITGLTNNREYDFQVRAVNLAGAGAQAEEEATPLLTVYAPPSTNNRPFFTEGSHTTRTVPEDAEAGTPVGFPVTATDQDNDQLEYSLSGTGQVSFDLDRRTGQITTKTLLDYETQSQYSVRVRVRDGQGGSDVINVTITVENVVEPPSQPGAPEVTSTGPTGLTVSWTAPDNQGPEITDYDLQYREADGEFKDVGYDGTGTSMPLSDLKPETGYEVQVRAINAEGVSPWSESGKGQTEEAPPPPIPTPEPTPTPTPEPTPTPTAGPTPTPTPEPTPTPTAEPTPTPTPEPTPTPTPEPTPAPTAEPTPTPTVEPTPAPTAEPTPTPTVEPTPAPTAEPTPTPTAEPTPTPTVEPTPTPTLEPAPSEADGGDEGFPWWAIVVVVIGVVAGVVLIIVVRRSRR